MYCLQPICQDVIVQVAKTKSVAVPAVISAGRDIVFCVVVLLRDTAGNPVTVPPGQPWISVFPDNRTIDWS